MSSMSKPTRTASEVLAMCDYARARRTDPARPLDRLTREQQRAFWRRPPFLATWRESRR